MQLYLIITGFTVTVIIIVRPVCAIQRQAVKNYVFTLLETILLRNNQNFHPVL